MSDLIRIRRSKGASVYHRTKEAEYLRDFFASYEDKVDEISEENRMLYRRELSMLRNNTAQMRKCENCGAIAIQQKSKIRFERNFRKRHFFCWACNYEYYKRPKPAWFNEAFKKREKLQPIWREIYKSYYKKIHEGVTIS